MVNPKSYDGRLHEEPSQGPKGPSGVSNPHECRSESGVTIGLIDGMIAIARVLAKRDLNQPGIAEALEDIRADEDIAFLLGSSNGNV